MKFYSFFFVILVLVSNSFAQGRETKSFGNDWLFFKGDQNWMVPLAAGRLKAVGKNNPFKTKRRKAFQGRCITYVKASRDSGSITISASSGAIRSNKVRLSATK